MNDRAAESFRQEQGPGAVVAPKRRFPMKLVSAAAAVAAITILISPVASFAQSAGGSAGGSSAGSSSGSAAGSPSAGSAGAASQGIAASLRARRPRRIEQCRRRSKRRGECVQACIARSRYQHRRHGAVVRRWRQHWQRCDHGSGRSAGSGTDMTGPQRSGDAEINEENKKIDRKIKSICRGC